MPLVSVIVPIHNASAYLAECLAGVECQTLRDIEILCLDDASEDDSAAICRSFAKQDERFRLVNFDKNQGAAAVRNYGIEHSQGEYLMFLDADDWYPHDGVIELLYRAATEHGVAVAAGEFTEYDEESGEIRSDFRDEPHLCLYNFEQDGIIEYADWQGEFGFHRFIYQKKLLISNNIRFPALIRHEDPVFLANALVAAGRFYALAQAVYRYRVNHKPLVLSEQALDDAIEAHVQLLLLAEREGLKQLKAYTLESLRWYMITQTPEARAMLQHVYDSRSFRIGNALLAPYHKLCELVGKEG